MLTQRSHRCAALVATLLMALSPTWAADMVGKDAPDFTVDETINEAPALAMSEMKGEVILIKYWGTR